MSRRADPGWRWGARHAVNLYGGAEAQLDRADLAAYAAALAEIVETLEPERAAWHARDLVLNAGEQGGAAPRLDLYGSLRAVAGAPSWHGRPRVLSADWTATLYRGVPDPAAPSWTPSARVAVTYADSDRRGAQQPHRSRCGWGSGVNGSLARNDHVTRASATGHHGSEPLACGHAGTRRTLGMTTTHPLPFNELGCLPMGRHTLTLAEAASYCQIPDSDRRSELWSSFEDLTRMVRGAVGRVPACWLSGSFFTDKNAPNDVDVVYLLAHEDVKNADDAGRKMLNLLSGKRVMRHLGMPVDAYYLDWWPRPGINRGATTDRPQRYLEHRGYWDDLWSRQRDSSYSLDKLPRRGYLEVIVDGYR